VNNADLFAQMRTFVAFRNKSANLRGAMDEIKATIGAYLQDNSVEELEDPGSETVARWRQNTYTKLDVRQLDTETLRWAADAGLLQGNVAAIKAQGRSAPQLVAVHSAMYEEAGDRWVDVQPPSYARRKELEAQAPAGLPEHARRAPPDEPSQVAQDYAPAPIRTVPLSQTPAARVAEVAPDRNPEGPVCPEHGLSKEGRWGTFCPRRKEGTKNGYCAWKPAEEAVA
jgi:hypothetical protein